MAHKKQYPSATQDQYMIRFPDGMRDHLKAEAARSGRSLNAEIINRLQMTLEADGLDDDVPGDNAQPDPNAITEQIVIRTIRRLIAEGVIPAPDDGGGELPAAAPHDKARP